jgi:hypothetical protein
MALNWAVAALLLALWSLAAWAFHAAATWAVSSTGALTGTPTAMADGWGVPDWLAVWLSPELTQMVTSLQSSLVPLIEAVLQQMPSLAGGLSTLVWVAWAVGAVLIVLLGLAASAVIVLLRSGKSLPWKR